MLVMCVMLALRQTPMLVADVTVRVGNTVPTPGLAVNTVCKSASLAANTNTTITCATPLNGRFVSIQASMV